AQSGLSLSTRVGGRAVLPPSPRKCKKTRFASHLFSHSCALRPPQLLSFDILAKNAGGGGLPCRGQGKPGAASCAGQECADLRHRVFDLPFQEHAAKLGRAAARVAFESGGAELEARGIGPRCRIADAEFPQTNVLFSDGPEKGSVTNSSMAAWRKSFA